MLSVSPDLVSIHDRGMAEDCSVAVENDVEYSSERFLRQHVTYLRQVLQNTTAHGAWIRTQASGEIGRLKALNEQLRASNASYSQHLQYVKTAHALAIQDLGVERAFRRADAAMINDQKRELAMCKSALDTTQRSLQIQREQLEEANAELDRTQRKFHLVDALVDTMLLQEDSQLEMTDRSRQVTDMILDLENQMEAKYRDLLRTKDMELVELRHVITTRKGDRARSQSEPPFPFWSDR